MSPKTIENFYKFDDYYLVLELNDYFEMINGLPLKEHFNSCNQILFLQEGECLSWVNNNIYKCSKRSIGTFSRNQLQKLEITDNAKGYILLFSDELLKEINYELFLEVSFLFFGFTYTLNHITLSDKKYSELFDIIKILTSNVYKINRQVKNDIAKNLIMRLLQIVKILKVGNKSVLLDRDKNLLMNFCLLLKDNIKYSRCVKYYADLLAISTKKLNNITKTYFSSTAKEFIEERIISDSKKLLIETPDTIKQISYTMGFTEPTNFNKFFKKYNSTTPLQFREQFTKGAF